MPRLPTLVILMAVTLTGGCNADWGKNAGALSQALPKNEIIGCYQASGALPIIRIEADRITADGELLYSSYDYGLGGRNGVPLLVVRPRMALQAEDDGTYSFKAWKQELGDSFSYDVTRKPAPSISISSVDAVQHRFVKVECR